MINESVIGSAASGPSLRAALAAGASCLNRAGIETAFLDAEVLLGCVLTMTREEMLSSSSMVLTGVQAQRFEEFLGRRLEREPVAYIVRRQEFWSLNFLVTPDVLIPRPETERLVETALALAIDLGPSAPLRILDIGTGSGAVAVSLAKELSLAEVWATDVSAAALAIARDNAARHGVGEKIWFRAGDLFQPVAEQAAGFALIVANPPYIRRGEIDGLAPEVSQWEPRAALDGGVDGLDFYRRIAANASSYLAAGGAVILEIGADMGRAVARLFDDSGRYARAEIFQDYAGRDRVIVARKLEQDGTSIGGSR